MYNQRGSDICPWANRKSFRTVHVKDDNSCLTDMCMPLRSTETVSTYRLHRYRRARHNYATEISITFDADYRRG